MLRSEQWCTHRGYCALRGPLDKLTCYNLGNANGVQWTELRDIAKYPTIYRKPPTKERYRLKMATGWGGQEPAVSMVQYVVGKKNVPIFHLSLLFLQMKDTFVIHKCIYERIK